MNTYIRNSKGPGPVNFRRVARKAHSIEKRARFSVAFRFRLGSRKEARILQNWCFWSSLFERAFRGAKTSLIGGGRTSKILVLPM